MDGQSTLYKEMVFSRISSLLAIQPLTFQQILKSSFNCDPSVLKKSIDDLVDDQNIVPFFSKSNHIFYKQIKIEKRSSSYSYFENHPTRTDPMQLPSEIKFPFLKDLLNAIEDLIPEATPVYSQWWFSRRSYQKLLKLILQYKISYEPIAFLACPTLGSVFSNIVNSAVHILDIDKVLLSKLSSLCSRLTSFVEYDASANIPSDLCSRFGFVFVDPPWSRSLINTFLVRGAALTLPGGNLAISLPPLLTRPSIPSERKEFFKIADKLGLRLISVFPSFTEYSVPEFERCAYQEVGLALDKSWRTGDLFIFTRIESGPIDVDIQTSSVSKWEQYLYEKRRLLLKRDSLNENGIPSISFMPSMNSFMYSSVSSRNKSWAESSLVSSRNCIAHAQGRKELASILENIFNRFHHNRTLNQRHNLSNDLKKTIFSMIGISNERKR